MQALEGLSIGQYRILRLLARGGMSDIYLAQDTHNTHNVVIKMVHDNNTEYCERFLHEVQTTAALQHPHILPALTHGKYESWCYMVSPYIEGGTLQQRLAHGPLSIQETGALFMQIASALQFAHDAGIIHRDIKPSNILIQDNNHAFLADFGLAHSIRLNTDLTATGHLIGTPEYMAPELAEESATFRSDIYALGVVLYQLLTGTLPFKGSTPVGTYLKHIREKPVPPTLLNPEIPLEIEDVVLRALDKNPAHRFASPDDMARAYRSALQESERYHQRQQITATIRAFALAATAQLKPIRQMRWSHASLAASLCFVLLPSALGFAFYTISRQPVNAAQVQSNSISGTQSTKIKTPIVIVTHQPDAKKTKTSASLPPRAVVLSAPQVTNKDDDDDDGNPANYPPRVTSNKDHHNHGNGSHKDKKTYSL